MTRTRTFLIWLVATGALVAAFFFAPAASATDWRAFVNICRPLAGGTADESQPALWGRYTITKTSRAYYRSLGWEVYTTYAYRAYLGLPDIGAREYGCAQVFDGTIPYALSGWDGVVDD